MKRSPDKTDHSDAHLLADLTRINYLPKVWLAPEPIRQLRRLMRHRAQLVRRRKDVKLRIRGLLRENRLQCSDAAAWTKAWLAWLQNAELAASDRWLMEDHLVELAALATRIQAVESRVKLATADDPLVARLMTLPGVGLVTAATMRAEIGRFDRFDTGKQVRPRMRVCSPRSRAKLNVPRAVSLCYDHRRQVQGYSPGGIGLWFDAGLFSLL